uniref:proton-coupled folate transporter-like isoform X1 n=2 Tax=Myxine glutinosa TaxID=7769 RepID=UPI00358F3A46
MDEHNVPPVQDPQPLPFSHSSASHDESNCSPSQSPTNSACHSPSHSPSSPRRSPSLSLSSSASHSHACPLPCLPRPSRSSSPIRPFSDPMSCCHRSRSPYLLPPSSPSLPRSARDSPAMDSEQLCSRCSPRTPCCHSSRSSLRSPCIWLGSAPVIALAMFGLAVLGPLTTQYMFRVLAGDNMSNATEHNACGNETTDPQLEIAEAEAARWNMWAGLAGGLLSLISTPLVGAASDKWGRQPVMGLTLLGLAVQASMTVAIVICNLSVPFIVVARAASGLLGDFSGLLAACFAYEADNCSPARRAPHIAILEASLGMAGMVAGLSTGPWMTAYGLVGPAWVCLAAQLAALAYVCFGLVEPKPHTLRRISMEETDAVENDHSSSKSINNDDLQGMIGWRTTREERPIHEMPENAAAPKIAADKTVVVSRPIGQDLKAQRFILSSLVGLLSSSYAQIPLAFLLVAFGVVVIVHFGAKDIFVVFEVAPPLCWSPLLVGFGSAAEHATYLTSLLILLIWTWGRTAGVEIRGGEKAQVFKRNECADVPVGAVQAKETELRILMKHWYPSWSVMATFGLMSSAAGLVTIGLARSTPILFIGYALRCLAMMTTPLLRTEMSHLAGPHRHGALFAVVGCVESASGLIASATFGSIYSATVTTARGLPFILGAALLVLPGALIMGASRLIPQKVEELMPVTQEEPALSQHNAELHDDNSAFG